MRHHVGHRRRHHRRLEAVGLTDRPRAQVTAVRLAGAGDARIGESLFLQRLHDGEVLRQIELAPAAAQTLRERLAVAARADRVRRHHRPAARQQHAPVPMRGVVDQRMALRSAVHVHQQRERALRRLRRGQHPGFDGLGAAVAVGHVERALAHARPDAARGPAAVVRGVAAFVAAVPAHRVQFHRPAHAGDGERQPLAAGAQLEHMAQARVEQPRVAATDRHHRDRLQAAPRADRRDAFAVRMPEHAGADRELEILAGQPAQAVGLHVVVPEGGARVALAVAAAERERAPVGRPAHAVGVGERFAHAPAPAAVGARDPQLATVALAAAGGAHVGQPLSVRRPLRAGHVEVAVDQARGPARGQLHAQQARALAGDEAAAVELVRQEVGHARAVGIGDPLAGQQQQRIARRREALDAAGRAVEPRQPARFAHVPRQQVDLQAVRIAAGEEGQRAAVGRELQRGGRMRARGDRARRTALRLLERQPRSHRVVAVPAATRAADDIGEMRVRRRAGQAPERAVVIEILRCEGLHAVCRGADGSAPRRSGARGEGSSDQRRWLRSSSRSWVRS